MPNGQHNPSDSGSSETAPSFANPMPTNPLPKRGDWYRTKVHRDGHRVRFACKEYSQPPSVLMNGQFISTLPAGHWMGPVHDARQHEEFVSIQVPSRTQPYRLVWVNIESCGTKFAELHPRIHSGFLD